MLVLQATPQGSGSVCPGRRRACGFTLLELMVAVAVVGIIAAIGYPGMAAVDGVSCSAGAVWNSWITVADVDRDGAVDDILRVSSVPAAVQLTASPVIQNSRIAFRSDGLAHATGGSLLSAWVAVCVPIGGALDNQRRISIGAGSRISTRSEIRGGQCSASGIV